MEIKDWNDGLGAIAAFLGIGAILFKGIKWVLTMLRQFVDWSRNLAAMPRLVAEASDKLSENSVLFHRRLQFIDISNYLLSDALGVARFRTDGTGSIISMSRAFCHLWGRTEEELLRTGYINALHPNDRDPILNHWQNCVRSGIEFQECCRVISADGEIQRICIQARPVFGDDCLEGYEGIARREEDGGHPPATAE